MDETVALKNDLGPTVRMFIGELLALQWLEAQSGCVDATTINGMEELCMLIVKGIATHIFEVIKQRQKLKQFVDTEKEAHHLVAQTITDIFGEVAHIPEDVWYDCAYELKNLAMKELAEKLNKDTAGCWRKDENSRFCYETREQTPLKPFPSRPKTMFKNIVKVVRQVTKMYPERVRTCNAIKKILKKQADDFSSLKRVLSIDCYDHLMSRTSQDVEKAASKIVASVKESTEAESCSSSERTSCQSQTWNQSESDLESNYAYNNNKHKRVETITRNLYVHRYAKATVLCAADELMRHPRDPQTLTNFFDGVENLMQRIIGLEADQETWEYSDGECLYERTASKILKWQELIKTQLGDLIFNYLRPVPIRRMYLRGVIQVKIERFLRTILGWLCQQMEKHRTKDDPVSAVLEKTTKITANLSASTPGLKEKTWDILSAIEEEPGADPVLIDENEDPALINDDADPAVIDEDEDPALPEDDSAFSVDDEEGTTEVDAGQQWNRNHCKFFTFRLVQRAKRKSQILAPYESFQAVFEKLAEMTWAEIENSVIALKPSVHAIKRTVKLVHKDLCKKMGDAWIQSVSSQLCRDSGSCQQVIETVMMHLITPKKTTGVRKIFRSIYETISRPFIALSRHMK
ncbi:uncharacterized protein V6R79_001206 [Siganus canaliculatus]